MRRFEYHTLVALLFAVCIIGTYIFLFANPFVMSALKGNTSALVVVAGFIVVLLFIIVNMIVSVSVIDLTELNKTVFNEQTKLLATALNTAATSSFTVGIATPIAGYIYNVGDLQTRLKPWVLAVGVFAWFLAATALHSVGRSILRRMRP